MYEKNYHEDPRSTHLFIKISSLPIEFSLAITFCLLTYFCQCEACPQLSMSATVTICK